jgi:NADH dehydrogenase/NADH:ubiquinone oxidoreductase subunit G
VASGMLSNEDWAGLKALFSDKLKVKDFLFTPEPEQLGEEDAMLRKKEKVPNLKGGENLGFKSLSWKDLESKLESGAVDALFVVERDLSKIWGDRTAKLLSKLKLVVYQGPAKNAASELAHYRLPATAYVEEEGHFTNFEGKVQAYKKALEPLGQAKPDWEIFGGLAEHLSSGRKREVAA